MQEPIYIGESIGLECPIKVGGVLITTSYASGAQMTDLSAGKGSCKVTVYDSAGAVAVDVLGVALQDIPMNRSTANSGTAVYTIIGLPDAGEYEAWSVYGVKDSSGSPSWQKPVVQKFLVSTPANSPTLPFGS